MHSRSPHTRARPGGFIAQHASPEDSERSHRRIIRRVWAGFVIVAVGLAVMVWSADVISFEDERTIYTVECHGGVWTEGRCTGRLKAADRIRFHASKSRGEVVFWKLGAPHQAERLAPCAVEDGRNWSCSPAGEASRPIPLALTKGHVPPVAAGGDQAFHVIKKWRWWLLRIGVPA
jgi:hypothetical protein